ncbi:hypothetical protein PAXRUDRAFT_171146, partial [Paxillus rubicundulus Ve08.2h10]
DSDDDNVHHSHVEPQQPETTCQTAINEAADTMDPNTMGTVAAVPVGTMNGPQNEGGEVDKDIKTEDEKGEWVSGIEDSSSNDDSGDKSICHMYIIPTLTLPPPYHALPHQENVCLLYRSSLISIEL